MRPLAYIAQGVLLYNCENVKHTSNHMPTKRDLYPMTEVAFIITDLRESENGIFWKLHLMRIYRLKQE
jgi:hypothetical protein